MTSDIINNHSIYIEKYFENGSRDNKLVLPDSFYKNPALWVAYQRDDGHYLSLKEPGLSFFLIPGYFFGGIFGAMISMAIVSSFISLIIYLFTSKITKNSKLGFITSITFTFATLLYTYSNQIYGDTIITLFLITVLYILFTKSYSKYYMSIAGVILGTGVFFKIIFIPLDVILLSLLIFMLAKRNINKDGFFLFIGFFSLITLFVLLNNLYMYHSLIGGQNSQSAMQVILNHHPSNGTFSYDLQAYRFSAIIESFFGKFHGLFIYSPIVALASLGSGIFWRRSRLLLVTTLAVSTTIFFGYIWLNPDSVVLAGDPPFRYFLPIIPLLAIPFSCGLEQFSNKIAYKIIFALTFAIGLSFSAFFGYDRLLSIDSSYWKADVISKIYLGLESLFPILGPSYGQFGEVFTPKPLSIYNIFYICSIIGLILFGVLRSFLKSEKSVNTKKS